ncbi:MAG: HD domain-containing protein [Pirellulales bacterium]|nr:HD domain-containing protein [Pirellulales bacterium]
MPNSPRAIVDRVFTAFRERGYRHYGESVTELEHALQAATFARRFGESEAVVAACLLHDYGHLLHDLGEDIAERGVDATHEELGARVLAEWFVPEVVEPTRLHVAAKRYLCWKDPRYRDGLSEASLRSLALQGGPMSEDEARRFERHAHFEAAVRVRRYDDMGKVAGMQTPDLEAFRATVEEFVRA